MFKRQAPSKYFYLLRLFPHCSKYFLNMSILMPFIVFLQFFFFCFTSFTSAKRFPLRTFFSSGKQKKGRSW